VETTSAISLVLCGWTVNPGGHESGHEGHEGDVKLLGVNNERVRDFHSSLNLFEAKWELAIALRSVLCQAVGA
jgi:hypothetical protein